ncbi:conserved hypothetical protein [Histoplasma capsulatum var. duboisii H88]|uniref:DH domain-containing protein n=2 Tax=Ajellomyces capsulatus (strain H88) TaxID=544711 RepID=F0UV26_AJEC8|nr:conserved hypothetical protein [Histoplasma capsulatum var. duboisii H88]
MNSMGGSMEEDRQGQSFGVSSASEPTAVSLIPASNQESHSFKRWIRSMRKRRTPNYDAPPRYVVGWPDDESKDESYRMFPTLYQSQPDRSSTASSSNLHTVKTASVGSLSMLTRPRTNTQTSTQRSACHSSALSGSDARVSMESGRLTSTLSLDEGAWNRAVQRRQVIREILETEITYLAGLKALVEVLTTLGITETALQRSTLDLISLHEDLMAKLEGMMPRSDRVITPIWMTARRHIKFGNMDAGLTRANRKSVTTRKLREPIDSRIKSSKSVAAEPNEAAAVAKIMQSMLPKFKVYEDYGVKYQLVTKEIDLLRKSITSWQDFDHGIEALLKNVASTNTREAISNQCFTLGDLLMKPIQRVCKYQLFLAELLKNTPVADCPSSHSIIEVALQQTLSVSRDINRATGDPVAKDRIRKTMLLGEKLEFARKGDRSVLHDFGPIKVCGALHVTYQAKDSVTGEYMLCCLFSKYLLLAAPCEDNRKFNAVAVILVQGASIEPADNCIGLHCLYAPFSWKLVFEIRKQTFEILLTGCSEREASSWKDHLLRQSLAEIPNSLDENTITQKYSTTQLAMKPIGAIVFAGQVHDLTRRSSIHGSPFTTPSHTDCVRLLIKGTQAVPHENYIRPSTLGRSQSLQLARQSIVLCPKRQDRIRMEKALYDVWTCDVLPYPGMPAWRGEHLIRSSAESFIRRLSSRRPFTRRSSSLTTTITAKSIERTATYKEENSIDDYIGPIETFSSWTNSIKTQEIVHEEAKDDFDRRLFGGVDPHQRKGSSRGRGEKKEASSPSGNERNKPSLRKRWSVSIFKGNTPVLPSIAC